MALMHTKPYTSCSQWLSMIVTSLLPIYSKGMTGRGGRAGGQGEQSPPNVCIGGGGPTVYTNRKLDGKKILSIQF